MALINCPQCGRQISDKATRCIHCGIDLKSTWIQTKICAECGNENSVDATECIYCGCPLEEKEESPIVEVGEPISVQKVFVEQPKDNKKKIVIPAIALLVIVVILLLFTRNNVDHGYFDNNKWGMSREEIEKKYGDNITESFLDEDALAQYTSNYMGIENLNSMVQFEFNDKDELYQIFLMISNESQMSNAEVYNMVVDKYTKAYGDSEETEYGLIWKTDKTQIAMKQYPGNSSGTMILYTKLGE